MVGKKNSTTRRRRRPRRIRIFREDDGRPDMGRLKRRWDEFTQTLLRDERLGKLKDITDLPPEFLPIVSEIEATCWYYWRPISDAWTRSVCDAWTRNDPVQAARELRQAVRSAIVEHASFTAKARATAARRSAWRRKGEGRNTRTKLERWEHESGIR